MVNRNLALNINDESVRIFCNDLSGPESEILLSHVKMLCFELGIIKEK